jgi:hypothetical protein
MVVAASSIPSFPTSLRSSTSASVFSDTPQANFTTSYLLSSSPTVDNNLMAQFSIFLASKGA